MKTQNIPLLRFEPATKAGIIERDVIFILCGSLIIALTAQIELPFWPVPLTGQTFGVMLVAGLLGSKRGFAAVAAYLAEGAAGLPVFAGASAGAWKFAGPTGGYLIGFLFAAYAAGLLIERAKSPSFTSNFIAMAIGTLIILLCGNLWLGVIVGWDSVLAYGLYPFIPGAIVKTLFAAGIVYAGTKISER